MATARNPGIWRAILITIIICTLSLPTYAKYSGGAGVPDDPYRIATVEDLMLLGDSRGDYNKHFILTTDIDLDPNLPGRKVFDKGVIAPDWFMPFTGVFNGNGFTISHLRIKGGEYLGLFGELGYEAVVHDLGVVDVNIAGSDSNVGGLTGYNVSGFVTRCYSTGVIHGRSSVGGLIGFNDRANVTQCYSTCVASGPESYIGGLIGYNSSGTVINCYSTGTVSGYWSVGGLVGQNDRSSLSQCYSAGSVSGISSIGGLAGHHYQGNITACFWDTQTSGQTTSAGGTGKTTAEMQTAGTFLEAGWDFMGETANGTDDIWKISEGLDYPRLWWELSAKYGGGTGEADDPYLIYTAEHLNAIGAEPNDWAMHFKLMGDIDLSGFSYDAALMAPDMDPCDLAFRGTPFKGVFDGNGHTIAHMTITGEHYLGLFGQLEAGAEIRNLGIVDANIIGSQYVGALVGFNKGDITTSYVTGAVSGQKRVGGLTGRNWRTITQSYNAATVTGNDDVGGLAATNYGSITDSYNTGAIVANWDAGGLAGENYGRIATSYSTSPIGGKARVGGLVGYNWPDTGTVSGFWDMETSGLSISDGGIGKTTAEMKTVATFLEAGWDFVDETANGTDDIWWILEGQDYPRLWWETDNN